MIDPGKQIGPPETQAGRATPLSERQAEVLQLAANGLSGKQIARQLGISVRTVEGHFGGMRQRTGARSDGELVAYGVATGVVYPALALDSAEGPQEPRKLPWPVHDPRAPLTGATRGPTEVRQLPAAPPDTSPSPPSRLRVGYTREGADGPNLIRQFDVLATARCGRIFADKEPGQNALRPELVACHAFLQPGDTLIVPSLDRYGRSLHDLISMVAELRTREIGFTSLHEHLDTTSPGGRLIFHVFAALAEFIREVAVTGTHPGQPATRTRGRTGGRPSVVTPEIIRAARELLPSPAHSVASIAKLLGVSPGTLYNHIPDLRQLRSAAARPAHGLPPIQTPATASPG